IHYLRHAARWPKEWTDSALAVLRRGFAPYRSDFLAKHTASVTASGASTPTTSYKARGPMGAFLAANEPATPLDPATHDYLADFINGTVVSLNGDAVDALAWWGSEREQGREWGGLTEMALDLFTCPVSSVAVERAFSFGRHVVSEKRHRLSGKTISRTMTVAAWGKAGWIPDGLLAKAKKAEKAAHKKGGRKSAKEVTLSDSEVEFQD
ncbi:hypothetical protein JCM10908_003533, partial [Rhodotorula pacifica]|uniref:uncharacterized protein n=1 Tax=Rhodotorula pacifica TaxID=1495444 RepID=UPI00317FB341